MDDVPKVEENNEESLLYRGSSNISDSENMNIINNTPGQKLNNVQNLSIENYERMRSESESGKCFIENKNNHFDNENIDVDHGNDEADEYYVNKDEDENENNNSENDNEDDEVGEDGDEYDDEDSDDDKIEITIDNIQNKPQLDVPNFPRSSTTVGGAIPGPKGMIDLEASGNINGVAVLDYDLDSSDDKPWRKPGADITDYFNYGFTEETWRSYCEKQKRLRNENIMIGKLATGLVNFASQIRQPNPNLTLVGPLQKPPPIMMQQKMTMQQQTINPVSVLTTTRDETPPPSPINDSPSTPPATNMLQTTVTMSSPSKTVVSSVRPTTIQTIGSAPSVGPDFSIPPPGFPHPGPSMPNFGPQAGFAHILGNLVGLGGFNPNIPPPDRPPFGLGFPHHPPNMNIPSMPIPQPTKSPTRSDHTPSPTEQVSKEITSPIVVKPWEREYRRTRSRSVDRDKERERERRYYEERERRERDRERYYRERDHKYRDRSYDRDHHRSRDRSYDRDHHRSRDRDYYKHVDESRERSRDRRKREYSDDEERSSRHKKHKKSSKKSKKDKDQERSRSGDRGHSQSPSMAREITPNSDTK